MTYVAVKRPNRLPKSHYNYTGAITKAKVFLTPSELRERFALTKKDYESLVRAGAPTIVCADVVRHPIDDFYEWCQNNDCHFADMRRSCNSRTLESLLSISAPTRLDWEKLGLPKHVVTINGRTETMYNVDEITEWLKNHTLTKGTL